MGIIVSGDIISNKPVSRLTQEHRDWAPWRSGVPMSVYVGASREGSNLGTCQRLPRALSEQADLQTRLYRVLATTWRFL